MKYPVVRTKSDRVDVEVIGPSRRWILRPECGGGGCQHLAGEFLFHCHVAHHYVAGMWGYAPFLQHIASRRGAHRHDAGFAGVAGSARAG